MTPPRARHPATDTEPTIDRWRHRRAHAWLAVVAGLAYPLLLLWTASDQLGSIAVYFYAFCTLVVTGYHVLATMDDKWQAAPKPPSTPTAATPTQQDEP